MHRKLCSILFLVSAAAAAPAEEPARPSAPATDAEPPITVSGSILGITIGMPMREARERLLPLREPIPGPLDEKEKAGQRTYWKLVGTEYDWVMAWANRDRKITKIRAVLRPEKLKPFEEIGDLTKALSSNPSAAVWDVMRQEGASFRLTALGAEGRAVRISMLALDPSLPEPAQAEEAD